MIQQQGCRTRVALNDRAFRACAAHVLEKFEQERSVREDVLHFDISV